MNASNISHRKCYQLIVVKVDIKIIIRIISKMMSI